MTASSFAHRERLELCDLALVLGEDAPTLCGDWDAKELVTHLLVREYSPLGSAGMAFGPLSKLTDREMARVGKKDFKVLVERLRRRGLTPFSLPPVETLFNTLEFFVHHEDLRRAQPGWEPRELPAETQDRLWTWIRVSGIGLARPARVPLRIRRTDSGATATLRPGRNPVTVAGQPAELVLYLFGRDEVRGLSFDGPPEAIAKVRGASFGF